MPLLRLAELLRKRELVDIAGRSQSLSRDQVDALLRRGLVVPVPEVKLAHQRVGRDGHAAPDTRRAEHRVDVHAAESVDVVDARVHEVDQLGNQFVERQEGKLAQIHHSGHREVVIDCLAV